VSSLKLWDYHSQSNVLEKGVRGKNPTLKGSLANNHRVFAGVCPPSASLVSSFRVIQTNGDLGIFSKKRRSSWFYLANSVFKRIRDLGFLERKRLEELVVYFNRWRESYRKKYVHLERSDNLHVFIKQYSRFDWDYKRSLRRKLRLLNHVLWDLKIELTIDPKKCMRYSDEFFLLQKGWNRLNSWLKRRFGEFLYFKVLEITKKGRPHFHILISGIKWIDQKELSDLWDSYGCGKIVYIKKVFGRNRLKMCAYVMKYVNKTLRKSDKLFSAVLFASNKRLFAMSKGCQAIVNAGKKPRFKKGFVFAGSILEQYLIEFCNERYVELEPFIVIEANFDDYREFPLVFGGFDYG